MDIYAPVSYKTSRLLTLSYSSSFGSSSYLFGKRLRKHIYAIYGMVRIADEIVDTYKGADADTLLDQFEREVFQAIERGYSTNPIIHAFCLTARKYRIDDTLIKPFFWSMRLDLTPQTFTAQLYRDYIHGSAEVVGLMCLRVFCNGDDDTYSKLEPGAASLGAAYQKVNFLRDLAADCTELGRMYFPDISYESFDEKEKQAVIADIQSDFDAARPALLRLPKSSRLATMVSYSYYLTLLRKLKSTPIDTIKQHRIRLGAGRKLLLFFKVIALESWKR